MVMNFGVELLFFCFCLVFVKNDESADLQEVEDLVKRWSPLIWMAPDEKHMPLNAEEFINHVYVADENGKKIQDHINGKMLKSNSKLFHFVPHRNLENLKNNTYSFLYGKNPSLYPVTTYALVRQCSYGYPVKQKDEKKEDNFSKSGGKTGFYLHISYWIFFPYNEGKEVCFLGKVPTPRLFNKCLGHLKTMGNHVGDWEHMSLSFAGMDYPEKLFLSVRDTGVYYSYDSHLKYFKFAYKVARKGVNQVPKFPEILRPQGDHPVIFSAKGSHGLWAAAGEYDFIRVPKLTDKNGYGTPWKTWNNIRIYHLGRSNLPLWMTFGGKWGIPRKNCFLLRKLGVCEFTDGPVGILRKKQDFYC